MPTAGNVPVDDPMTVTTRALVSGVNTTRGPEDLPTWAAFGGLGGVVGFGGTVGFGGETGLLNGGGHGGPLGGDTGLLTGRLTGSTQAAARRRHARRSDRPAH